MAPQALFLLAGTALSLLLQVAAVFIGPFGFVVGVLTPLPAAYAGMRQGGAVAGGIVLLTAAALFGVSGAMGALSYLLQYGFPAWLLSLLLRRGWDWDRAAAGTLLGFAALAGIALSVFAALQGAGLPVLVRRYVEAEVGRAMSFWQEAALPADQLDELRQISEQMGRFLIQAWPAILLVAAGALILFIILVLSAAAKDRYRIAGLPFRHWKTPEPMIWLLIAAGIGMLFAEGVLQRVTLNLLVVVLPLYFLQGVAIVSFWFRKKSVSPFFRNLGYLFIVIINPLPILITGLGVFDLWIDFRKPRLKKN